MLARKWYALGILVVAGSLLVSTCGPRGGVVPLEGTIEEVEVTSPPKIDEATVDVGIEGRAEPTQESLGLDTRCTYNAYVDGWVLDYGDPENILNVKFHPGSPFQYTSWDDQAFRDLVDRF